MNLNLYGGGQGSGVDLTTGYIVGTGMQARRHRIRDGYEGEVVERPLTALGFDGVEDIDWKVTFEF